jgi:hypothetical protein
MTKCKADRGIHQLSGLSVVQVEPLLNRLKADKSREARSLRRECRLWFKRNAADGQAGRGQGFGANGNLGQVDCGDGLTNGLASGLIGS